MTNLPVLNLPYGLGANTVVPHLLARSDIFSSRIYRGLAERPSVHASTIELNMVSRTRSMPKVYQVAGQRLDQSDADVMLELINMLFADSKSSSAKIITIERSSFIAKLGRPKGGKTNVLLAASLKRLANASFVLQNEMGMLDPLKFLRLVESSNSDLSPGRIHIEIEPTFIDLFKSNQWAILKKLERNELKSPLARALYAYYRTHNSSPLPLLQKTIMSLTGREEGGAMQIKKFKPQLVSALAELKNATGWHRCELVIDEKREPIVVVEKTADAFFKKKIKRDSVMISSEKYDDEYDI